jgi:hypothetical protein
LLSPHLANDSGRFLAEDGNQLLISRTQHVLRHISEYVIASLLYDNIAGDVLLLFTTVNFILSSNTRLIFSEQIFTISKLFLPTNALFIKT